MTEPIYDKLVGETDEDPFADPWPQIEKVSQGRTTKLWLEAPAADEPKSSSDTAVIPRVKITTEKGKRA